MFLQKKKINQPLGSDDNLISEEKILEKEEYRIDYLQPLSIVAINTNIIESKIDNININDNE